MNTKFPIPSLSERINFKKRQPSLGPLNRSLKVLPLGTAKWECRFQELKYHAVVGGLEAQSMCQVPGEKSRGSSSYTSITLFAAEGQSK